MVPKPAHLGRQYGSQFEEQLGRIRRPCVVRDPGLRWVQARAEEFRPDTRYFLIVAAESFHWMEWQEVLSWIPEALLPGAFLCLVSGREIAPVPWAAALSRLVARYATNREYRPYDLVSELSERELFAEVGRVVTGAVGCEQPIDSYVESFHTRSGLSPERMSATAAEAFDDALRRLVVAYCPDGMVCGQTTATLVRAEPRPLARGGGCG